MDKEERSCYYCAYLDRPRSEEPCKECENYDRFEKYHGPNEQTVNEKLGILGE